MSGRACLRDTRIPVGKIVGLMAAGWTEAEVLEAHPSLQHADILAAVAYAVACL